MRSINYQKNYLRDIEVQVTEEQYAALHQREDEKARNEAEQFVVDKALEVEDSVQLEFWMGTATDEADEEVFDRG